MIRYGPGQVYVDGKLVGEAVSVTMNTHGPCPDRGACHHRCEAPVCYRVVAAGPVSGYYPDDVWPHQVRMEHDPAYPGTFVAVATELQLAVREFGRQIAIALEPVVDFVLSLPELLGLSDRVVERYAVEVLGTTEADVRDVHRREGGYEVRLWNYRRLWVDEDALHAWAEDRALDPRQLLELDR